MRAAVFTRLNLYEFLLARRDDILAEAAAAAAEIAVPDELRGQIGPSGSNSALPGTMRRDILDEIEKGMMRVQSPRELGDEIRRIVKSVYGDEYDAAPANSCEAALGIAFDALLVPPSMGGGQPYRARVVGLLERHAEHQLSYGRPFPPIHKDAFADRGAIAGEFGLLGRRREQTDCVFVPLVGARYELHGSKMLPAPLLMETRAADTADAVARAAEIHAQDLTGFVSLSYDTPGYGYAEHGENGAPTLLQRIGAQAARRGLPYLCDNAWGVPFLGTDPRAIQADAMLYSLDKVSGAPTSGLIIGREWSMVGIRRALGVQSERFGVPSAHGKASHVAADPGKMTMLGIVAALRMLRDAPERFTGPIDATHAVVEDEFARRRGRLPEGIVISKSYNLGGVEVNYERTWKTGSGRPGIPIFTNEDRIAGAQILNAAIGRMGVLPGQAEDANIVFSPGLGTVDAQGDLIEERMRLVVRATFRALELLFDWASRFSEGGGR